VPRTLAGREYLAYKVTGVATKPSKKLELATGEDNIDAVRQKMNQLILEAMKKEGADYSMMVI
jgi:hypothetical protein